MRRHALFARQSWLVGQGQVREPEEFVVVGCTDPEGTSPWLGALCSLITIRPGASFMPGVWGRELTGPSSAGSGIACNRLATPEMPLNQAPPSVESVWLTAGAKSRALGTARAYRRGQVFDLDR